MRRARPHRFGGSGATRINEKTYSNSLQKTSDQKEFEGIRPGRLLGFVLHVNRQTVRLRSWRRTPYELRLCWNPIHSPRLRSWNYTSGELRRHRETSSQHPNFGCGASSFLGYGCKRNNLGWTGFYLTVVFVVNRFVCDCFFSLLYQCFTCNRSFR